MVDVAQVKIYGIPMGVFRLDNRYDNVQFEYDNDFVSKGLEPSPLMMPTLAGRIYSFADLGRETCDTASSWPSIAKECDVPENMIEKIFNNFLIHI